MKDAKGRKLKIGDKVKCLKDCGGAYTKGKVYTVTGYNLRWNHLIITDNKGNKDNGWAPKFFEKIGNEKFQELKKKLVRE